MEHRCGFQIHRGEGPCESGIKGLQRSLQQRETCMVTLSRKSLWAVAALFPDTLQVMVRQVFAQLTSQVQWLIRKLCCDHSAFDCGKGRAQADSLRMHSYFVAS